MRCSVLLLAASARILLVSADVTSQSDLPDLPPSDLPDSPVAKKTKTQPEEQPAQKDTSAALDPPAPERQTLTAGINTAPAAPAAPATPAAPVDDGYGPSGSDDQNLFGPTTQAPGFKKFIGPVVGGVIGAGALAGVIAVSVMKQPTTLKPGAFAAKVTGLAGDAKAGGTQITVANQAGFTVGSNVVLDVGTPVEEVNQVVGFGSLVLKTPLKFNHNNGAKVATVPSSEVPALIAKENQAIGVPKMRGAGETTAAPSGTEAPTLSSGMTTSTVLMVACGLVVCGLLAVCIICVLHCFGGKKKRGKTRPTRETAIVPEDQQPLNAGVNRDLPLAPTTDLPGMESQYMPVAPPQMSAYSAQPSAYIAQPSTYAQQSAYSAQPSAYAGIGSVPTMQNVVPMQTMPPPPPQSVYAPATTGFTPASPLANTVNALPTTANSNMPQIPPTIYG